MIKTNLEEIVSMTKAEVFQGDNVNICGVSIDTRNIKEGNLFIPLHGNNSDGHQFIENAIKNGASAALWQKEEPNPPKDFPLIFVDDTLKALQTLAASYRHQMNGTFIGITGSNGKTTTKDILGNILSVDYKVGKTKGNFNNEIGVPLTLLDLNKDVDFAVVELGLSHKGDISFLTSIVKPDIGLITNIGHAHINNFESIEKIAAAKVELVEGLRVDGVLFYNGDQEVLENHINKNTVNTVTFGRGANNDYDLKNIKSTRNGNQFMTSGSNFLFHISLLGEHQVMNALSAIAIAQYIGMGEEEIQKGLEITIPSDKRNDVRKIGKITIINDTYKSNPESVKAALHSLYNINENGKKLFVMGDMVDMGNEEISIHQRVADDLLPEHLDAVFGMGDLTEYTIQKARERFNEKKAVFFEDEDKLVCRILDYAKEDCIILFKASRALQFDRLVERVEKEI
ncbi:UDP-N-acetylmuramoyl-tripeptide--D-alanyl-D-alanine ligase [Chengkuizengella marina]|uniref:UDP-N-acetylmuramoyl-tripeptide--D-alanyl-D-alanine ligase n=1 Tax=Chengkuizengella marina TaxID=2507566 RepID=A0A6N9Q5Z0_9BACL|nr:UDP-N-acetylmuramoyl-tripeptide--D-alanyl-D-alanine ligase [Chengkuizengella marina]NBI30113.1 UDP-N-acetylmuramoyl-tripeptide--D-alanyl-D-alanine ligase [Chengkuizengella marina]